MRTDAFALSSQMQDYDMTALPISHGLDKSLTYLLDVLPSYLGLSWWISPTAAKSHAIMGLVGTSSFRAYLAETNPMRPALNGSHAP